MAIQVSVRWCLIVVLICISLVITDVSCASWPSVFLPLRNVYLDLLPPVFLFWLLGMWDLLWPGGQRLAPTLRAQSPSQWPPREILPALWLGSLVFDRASRAVCVLWRLTQMSPMLWVVFSFCGSFAVKVLLINSCLFFTLGGHQKTHCCDLSEYSFFFLHLGLWSISSLFLCMVLGNVPIWSCHMELSSTTYWRDSLFSIVYACLLCHRLIGHRCLFISGLASVFRWSVFLCL